VMPLAGSVSELQTVAAQRLGKSSSSMLFPIRCG
jgi:hypothetical protein